MKLSSSDKILLDAALQTELARVKRAINAEKSQAIKEIHGQMQAQLHDLIGRVSKEPTV